MILVQTIKNTERRFQTFPDISLTKNLLESRITLNNTFIKGAHFGVSDELRD